jgi:hypothetical protein
MQKTNSAPEAKAELDKLDALKKRAAKQAAKRELAPTVHPEVVCTVLPMGDGRISMGEHVAGLGTAHYEEGETFGTALPVALNLYLRGFVNFDGAKEAIADYRKAHQAQEAADRREKEEFDRVVGGAGG